MKYIFPFLFCITFMAEVSGQHVNMQLVTYTWRDARNLPYVELYSVFEGNSLAYQTLSNGNQQSEIILTYILARGENVISYDKISLKSPELSSTREEKENLMDVRILVADTGWLELEVYIENPGEDDTATVSFTDSIYIDLKLTEAQISQIEFLSFYGPAKDGSIFNRGSMELVPYFDTRYNSQQEKLAFYIEVYNTDKKLSPGSPYLLNCYIEDYTSKKIIDGYIYRKRDVSGPLKPYLAEFNISELSSGNYNLITEIRDSNNQLVTSQTRFFSRKNPNQSVNYDNMEAIAYENTFVDHISDPDSLKYIIRSFKPLSSSEEDKFNRNIVKNGDPGLMKRYILSFWKNRNSYDPEYAFKQYMKEVKKVENSFGSAFTKGYATDRGRVYLQYGAPNTISERPNEPGAYPYEIWMYYELEGQTNVRFVFYMPEQGTAEYYLLHSDKRGEINNTRWQTFLFQRNNSFNFDDSRPVNQYGNWSDDLYRNPR